MKATERGQLPSVAPEAVGIPSEAVARFIRKLEDKRLAMHGVMLLRHGQVATEAYWRPFDRERKHRMYSTSKSFVSVAIGILQGEGRLSIHDRVTKFFPELLPAELHPYIATTTIRDLLVLATPHFHGRCTYSPSAPDWAATFFNTPPTHLPGRIFSYDTTATFMLCAIVRKVAGVEFTAYLRDRLFVPAGMSEDIWCIESPCGHEWGGSGVLCTMRDLAKFALTCLQGGRINGQQLIPEDYIRAATASQIDNTLTATDAEHRYGYGYQFWRTRHNGFACRGMGSQLAVCLPDQDFILITIGDTQAIPAGAALIYEALWTEIFPHLQANRRLPENSVQESALRKLAGSLSLLTVEGERQSETAGRIDGKSYRMTENAMGLKRLSFTFGREQGTLRYENRTGEHALTFGFGHQHRQAFPETHYYGSRIGTPRGTGYECHSSAAWVAPASLLVYCYATDDYLGTLKMQFAFDGDSVTVLMDKAAEWFFGDYVGFASGKQELH
jgi:CubicO group peptidase (beta-lactamase class C family)